MGVWIERMRCIGCGECVKICPGDLLYLDQEEKVMIRNQQECWVCMACIKSCIFEALAPKLPFFIADFRASLRPYPNKRGIRWLSKNRDGQVEEFLRPG